MEVDGEVEAATVLCVVVDIRNERRNGPVGMEVAWIKHVGRHNESVVLHVEIVGVDSYQSFSEARIEAQPVLFAFYEPEVFVTTAL